MDYSGRRWMSHGRKGLQLPSRSDHVRPGPGERSLIRLCRDSLSVYQVSIAF